jgi:hypothetical protein
MYFRLPAAMLLTWSTPGSFLNSRIIVSVENPHNSASSFTLKCFLNADKWSVLGLLRGEAPIGLHL